MAGVGEEERPVWVECARCLQGGTSAGLVVGVREVRVVTVSAAGCAEDGRVGGLWSARVGKACEVREPAGEEGVADGMSSQGAWLTSRRGVSRARRDVEVGRLPSAMCWLWVEGCWLWAVCWRGCDRCWSVVVSLEVGAAFSSVECCGVGALPE